MPRETPESKLDQPQDVVNIMFTLASVDVACVTPILRSGFGTHAFAAYPMAVVWMFLYAGFGRCPLLLYYLPVWLAMIVVRRLTASRSVHSRYQGYPWIFGWMVNEYVARIGEVFVVFFAAVFASAYYPPLVKFLMLKIITLLIVFATEQSVNSARRRAIHDARIEAEWMNRLSNQ